MSYKKGVMSLRKIDRILTDNGYTYVRNNGHQIWKGPKGNTIVIPRSCCTVLINKLFKKNNLEF